MSVVEAVWEPNTSEAESKQEAQTEESQVAEGAEKIDA
jgi:hypothetical protein